MTMSSPVNPAYIFFIAALLLPLFRGGLRKVYLLTVPLIALGLCFKLSHGSYDGPILFGYDATIFRVDHLSYIFGLIFHIAAFINTLYGLHEKDNLQHTSGWIYAGAAIGAVFSGDLISLFIFWEITAISSVFLIWARRSERAYKAGMRYLIVQVASGVLLLGGAVLHSMDTGGDFSFGHLGIETLAGKIILLAFGIKCAFPFLHNWLQDAYPEATPVGTVMLSAFTTKLAVYSLARGYAGTEILIPIGAAMTAFPIFYAVIENDLRRVLAYSLNNQLGFMVVGIGIGTELALNGTAAHAFAHILYKALLFMSMGAVLHRVGHCNGSNLGGLYKKMPWTTAFCCIGAASISAFPLFSGFVSKSMILTAAAQEHHFITWLILLFASAGVFHHSGIKIPYFAFFGHQSKLDVKEAPFNMLAAMAIASVLCIGLGVFYGPLYAILPFPVDYHPYTSPHVLTQMQLLMFSALAFTVLTRTGIYPPELRSINLDTDWFYRKPGKYIAQKVHGLILSSGEKSMRIISESSKTFTAILELNIGPLSRYARSQSTSSMTFWVALVLALLMIFYHL